MQKSLLDKVTCASVPPKDQVVISQDRINDGYCDCPFDGLDEFETEACSGSVVGGWAGFARGNQHDGYVFIFTLLCIVARARYPSTSHTLLTPSYIYSVKFTCPQQPNLALPVSRIHDGICDCCDGADEPSGTCPNICDQVLKEERERQHRLKQNFQLGSKRRKDEFNTYQEMLVNTQTRNWKHVSQEYNTVESEMNQLQEEINQLKHDQLKQRLLSMKDTILSLSHESSTNEEAPLKGLLEPLSEEGLVTVIVQACQLAGEVQHSGWDASTCVPLRLAGLDVGIVWGNEDYEEGTVTEERLDLSTTTWQDLIDLNAAGETVWSVDALQKSSSRNDDSWTR